MARHLVAGTTVDNVQRLHAKYGEVVRLSPNEVSFISGETAWTDIYGFRTGKMKGHENMQKDPAWYAQPPVASHIIVANDADHTRFRRVLSHAFSEKALAQQEVLLQGYVDLLINRIKEVVAKDRAPQDMTEWYNWTTFDIIADLMFGEPFGCLQDLATHKYIDLLFGSLKAFRYYYIQYYWPFTKRPLKVLAGKAAGEARLEFYAWVASKTRARVERETQRPDFMTEILKHNGEKGVEVSPAELASNAVVFLTAGSETTATLLSAVTYCLLKNPEVMQKLKAEVRGRWKKYDDITVDEVNKSPYLLAVLQEALRYFPPVPTGFERRVSKGGEFVSGYFVPEGTALCVSSWPTAHSERNFKDPDAFVPERWMGDARYAGDNRDSMQPFSFGPRNCLGKVCCPDPTLVQFRERDEVSLGGFMLTS
jgi:cytochrome P450